MISLDKLQFTVNQLFEKENLLAEPVELYEPIKYTINLGGKRIRPFLVLLSCNLFDKEIEKAYNSAIAIEIFHNFTLIHDDIMDNAPIRRGKETVYRKWNSNIAILSGDTMFALAYKYFLKTELNNISEILNVFNNTAIEVCEGQQYDMNFETANKVSIDDYLKMIRLKTAVLLGCSLKVGAIIGGASNKDKENIYNFGVNLGIAFQLMDDLLDVYSDETKFGKKTGGDIVANKKTYLYLKTIELANTDILNKFYHFLDADIDENEKIKGVINIYNDLNIKQHTENEMNKYYDEALKYLNKLSINSEYKNVLVSFANKLMTRDK